MEHGMKFGLSIANHGDYGDIHRMVEFAILAEEAGWDGFFLWDHIARGEVPQIDSWIAISAIAAQTSRMRLGLLVTPLSRRRPWKVAREIVTLDHLSKGRMVLGVGLGDFQENEFANFGEIADQRERGEMLDEGLEIINGLQSGEVFHFSGKYYTVEKTVFTPKPVQQPRVPVWVAGKWPNKKPFQRAARWDGAIPIHRSRDFRLPLPLDEVREIMQFIQQYRQADTPFDFCLQAALLAKKLSEDKALVSPYAEIGVSWWIEYIYSGTGSVQRNRERIRYGPPC
jgi:alkanesulfonate monooxygenase SsuD/methylene tetrahydromethanopterin reductase-like flavin-dependent oxidoreductase (luciferase family)